MSRLISTIACALSGGLMLAGCASTPTIIPTAQRSGQGWVVTRTAVAAQLLQACPHGIADQAQQLFAPSRAQIDQLEAHLDHLDISIDRPVDRQYVGVGLAGRQLIYLRGFAARDHRIQDPSRELVSDCEDGFEVLFDPATGQFEKLHHFNLPAGGND